MLRLRPESLRRRRVDWGRLRGLMKLNSSAARPPSPYSPRSAELGATTRSACARMKPARERAPRVVPPRTFPPSTHDGCSRIPNPSWPQVSSKKCQQSNSGGFVTHRTTVCQVSSCSLPKSMGPCERCAVVPPEPRSKKCGLTWRFLAGREPYSARNGSTLPCCSPRIRLAPRSGSGPHAPKLVVRPDRRPWG